MATFIGLLSSVLYTNRSYIKKTFTLTIACHPIPRVTSITGTCEASISVTAVSIHITCMVTSSTFINIYGQKRYYIAHTVKSTFMLEDKIYSHQSFRAKVKNIHIHV